MYGGCREVAKTNLSLYEDTKGESKYTEMSFNKVFPSYTWSLEEKFSLYAHIYLNIQKK